MKIAVDIDGILTNETSGVSYSKRTPNQVNIDKVNQLHDAGVKINLFTSRYESDRVITKKWLNKCKVQYDKLIMGKPQYDFIWDDKFFQQVEQHSSKQRPCTRISLGPLPPTEEHLCFYCGEPIPLSTGDCQKCGIMKCPSCGKCFCDATIVEKLFLFTVHHQVCCKLDSPNWKKLSEISLDNQVYDMRNNVKTSVSNCIYLHKERSINEQPTK